MAGIMQCSSDRQSVGVICETLLTQTHAGSAAHEASYPRHAELSTSGNIYRQTTVTKHAWSGHSIMQTAFRVSQAGSWCNTSLCWFDRNHCSENIKQRAEANCIRVCLHKLQAGNT